MMFSTFDAFSLMGSSAGGMAVERAPSQAVWEAVGLGGDGPQTVGTSATSAVAPHESANPAAPAAPMAQEESPISIEDGTCAEVEGGLPAKTGLKRPRKYPNRVTCSVEWTVAFPEDHLVPSLFFSSKLRGCAPKKC